MKNFKRRGGRGRRRRSSKRGSFKRKRYITVKRGGIRL